MKTLAILLVFLVVVCVFVAQHPAYAGCEFQTCWAKCQAQHQIYFRRAFCDGPTCQCVFVTGG
uniref:Termicin n=2 Tax=Macrotermitinae TaxID=62955 RepID=D2D037_9NEOP|nr:termicin [Odontotermes formosanus]ACO90332.1 termicin [Macrotermes barneyi]